MRKKQIYEKPRICISNLNIQMKIAVRRSYGPERATVEEDVLISVGELDEDIFTMADERALLKAILAYINDGGES